MKLQGVFCAASTPLQADGSPDLDRLVRHSAQLLQDGCDGLALLGTTGEANSFSVGERQSIVEAVVDGGISADLLMPGVGTCSISDTVALARHGLSLGVTKFLVLPPFYYKNPSDDGLFAAYSEVVERLTDTRLKIILYHIPQTSNVPLGLDLIGRLIDRFPSIVIGIKDSSGDLDHMQSITDNFPGFSLFSGSDHVMLPMLHKGGAGCITACANFMAANLATVFHNFDKPEYKAEVDATQSRIIKIRSIATKFVQLPAIKALVARRYNDDAWLRVRPPFVSSPAAEILELDRLMTELESI